MVYSVDGAIERERIDFGAAWESCARALLEKRKRVLDEARREGTLSYSLHGSASEKSIVNGMHLFRVGRDVNSNLNRCRQILIGLGCFVASFAGGATAQSPTNGEPVAVVTSVYPLALLAREIGRDAVTVTSLIPHGADPHAYEPTPGVLRSLVGADLVLGNGAGVDGWIRRAARSGRVLMAEETAVVGGGSSPESGASLWLDPQVMAIFAGRIADKLCEVRAAACPAITARAGEVAAGIRATIAEAKARAAARRSGHIISFHLVWGRLAAQLGITEIGGFAECETRARTWGLLREARRVIESERVAFLVVEPLHEGSADMKQIVGELHLEPFPLDSMGARATDYRSFLKEAIAGLERASGAA